MTTTKTDEGPAPEVRRRAGQLMAGSDTLTDWNEALALAGAQLSAEQAARAAREASADAMVASFEAMTTCACGASKIGSRTGFCDRCTAVAAAVQAERAGAEMVGDQTRRALVEAVLDRRAESRRSAS